MKWSGGRPNRPVLNRSGVLVLAVVVIGQEQRALIRAAPVGVTSSPTADGGLYYGWEGKGEMSL
jgi:hypothetical protein